MQYNYCHIKEKFVDIQHKVRAPHEDEAEIRVMSLPTVAMGVGES